MARGGARPGAGRKKGQLSKRSQEILSRSAVEGITPLEVMTNLMREAWQANDRDKAGYWAEKAAPYWHPRMAAIEHSGETTTNVISASPELKPDEWARAHADQRATAH